MHTESFLVVLRVWEHANEVKGYDPSIWRTHISTLYCHFMKIV